MRFPARRKGMVMEVFSLEGCGSLLKAKNKLAGNTGSAKDLERGINAAIIANIIYLNLKAIKY
jgi:hypothetical protein